MNADHGGSFVENTKPTLLSQSIIYSSANCPQNHRQDWLCDGLGKECPTVISNNFFTQIIIYLWDEVGLPERCPTQISIQHLHCGQDLNMKDIYFANLHLPSDYRLQQNGKEVVLQPDNIRLFDASIAHHPDYMPQLPLVVIAIPRSLLKEKIPNIAGYTALHILGNTGIGAVVRDFIRSTFSQAKQLNPQEFAAVSAYVLDLLIIALASVSPAQYNVSRSRSFALKQTKAFIGQHLTDPSLNPAKVAKGVGLSSRYINNLFKDEDTSLMRYIWQRRLESCHNTMLDPLYLGLRISEIAYRWGFNDLSHFSRVFRGRYGCSPKEYRLANTTGKFLN